MVRETGVQSQVNSYQRLKKSTIITIRVLNNTQYHKIRIKDKVEQSRGGIAPFPIPQYGSYWKGSLRVDLD